ncbi:phosphoglycerate mutase [Pilimelia terevasa]|uniref:Phosphoglycerate mutase n=1 Tax=Pilimelia terevasa TaxID=53372 RepID=A0A8J3BRP9_9ACTN|nr:histidine phosphatase family protein [Pilimelia terevasa]GGK41044.1 phosphoglycerate mutase [Pilimelia terevasa]
MTAGQLVVWRHGNTDWNREGRVQGGTDVPLNDLGRAQAAATARALAALAPTAIVSSDLRRAADTAAALAAQTGLPVRTDARLRERFFGQWQGRLMADVRREHAAAHARWTAGDPDPGCDIEPVDALAARGVAGLRAAHDPAGTTVVVSHGGTARYAVAGLLGWTAQARATLAGLDNCAWAVLAPRGAGWQLRAYNLTAPLDAAATGDLAGEPAESR